MNQSDMVAWANIMRNASTRAKNGKSLKVMQVNIILKDGVPLDHTIKTRSLSGKNKRILDELIDLLL